MIETAFLLFGLAFSFLIYFRSIRTAGFSGLRKALYFLLTLTGVTGMLFLSGILIADFLRSKGFLH